MPLPFAPLVGLALGAAFAWVAAQELSRTEGPVVASRSFAIVVAFAGLVWVPVLGYFVAFHGDWSYLYLVPWRRVPSAIDLGLVLVAALAVVAGFALSVEPIRKRRFPRVVGIIVAPATIVVAGLILSARRLAVSGTYAQFHGDFGTQPIGSSPLGKGVLFMATVLAAAVAWTAVSLARPGGRGGANAGAHSDTRES
jgi:hypothetical protein